MRIIAGTFKGRVLQAPTWEGLRPTSDRLRETLFNILAPRIEGARVADVCAGTGAVGLEALSRGAAHVTFVEQDPRAVTLIAANVRKCGVTGSYTVDRRDALAPATKAPGPPFDIVFLDPPYAQRDLARWVARAAAMLAPGGVAVLEHGSRLAPPEEAAGLVLGRRLRQGDSALAFYAHAGGEPE